MTRMQNLKRDIETMNEKCDRLEALMRALTIRSDQDATALLARLRLGENVDDLAAKAKIVQDSQSF